MTAAPERLAHAASGHVDPRLHHGVEDAASSFFKITVQLSDLAIELAEVFLYLLLVAMQV